MPLPETIRVKLSSEAAESIAITRVVVEEMSPVKLIEVVLGVTGKDVERIRDLLSRGSIVSGATRFRWPPLEASSNEVETLLRRFPDADPARPFHPADCANVVLRGPLKAVYLARETAARRGLLRRRTVWDVLMECAAETGLEYLDYSYRDRADRYRLKLSPEVARELAAFGYSADTAEYLVGR